MRESRTYGSVRGALSNGRPYRVRLTRSAQEAFPQQSEIALLTVTLAQLLLVQSHSLFHELIRGTRQKYTARLHKLESLRLHL